jgi:hypothetical protein
MSERLEAELLADVSNYVRNMRLAANESVKTQGTIEKATDSISNAFTSKLSGVFSVAAIAGFAKSVMDATAEYQKFDAVLTNTLGSQQLASLKLQEIATFAAQKPFGINELTASFVKLANAGFKPTNDQMTKLGDLASSTGKSFDQLAEAILDAQTGEFERLKEFGVRAKDAGDSVIFTYKGVQTQVEKTSGSIRDYITSLGAAEGTSGSMAKISETLGGKISNLGDAWDQMLISVGKNTDGVFTASINIIGEAISKVTQYNNELNTVSRFKLGSNGNDFFKQLNRAINPFAGKGATELEKAVFNVQSAEKAVGDFVSKAASGATDVNAFGKAMADLKKQGDLALSMRTAASFGAEVKKQGLSFDEAMAKSKDMGFLKTKEEVAAVKRIYEDGFQAIRDARKNFIKDSKNTDANFGKGKNDKDKVSIPAKLEIPNSAEIEAKEFTRNFKSLTGLDALKVDVPKVEFVGKLEPIQMPKLVAFDLAKQQLILDTEKFLELATSQINSLTTIQSVLGTVSEAMGNGFGAIGSAIVDGSNIIEAAGSALLGTISSFISELGRALIKQGIATIAAGVALNIILPGSGANKVAGGIGLVAAGGALSIAGGTGTALANSKSSKGTNNASGTQQQYRPFAKGGIVYGPTVGLMGEYPGASSNPEVVAPLNKLQELIGGGQGVVVNASLGISMRELVVKIRQEEKLMGRMG